MTFYGSHGGSHECTRTAMMKLLQFIKLKRLVNGHDFNCYDVSELNVIFGKW